MHPGTLPVLVFEDAEGNVIYQEYATKKIIDGSQMELQSLMSEPADLSLGKRLHQP